MPINIVVQTNQVTVKATTAAWTDSGMVIPRGQGLRVYADGRVKDGSSSRDASFPEGTYPEPDENEAGHVEDLGAVDTTTGAATGNRHPVPELRRNSLVMVLWPDGDTPPYKLDTFPPDVAVQTNREYIALPVADSVFDDRGSDSLRVWFVFNDGNLSNNKGAFSVRCERVEEAEIDPTGGEVGGGRTIPGELFSLLQAQSQHPAWCWVIAPLSGEMEFYTSLDIPLSLPDYVSANGENPIPAATYLHGHGVEITAIPTTLKIETDGTDVTTLNFDRLKLLGGYYFGASVEVFEVDWLNPNAGRWVAFSGHLGNAVVGDIGATIELATWDELLVKRRSSVTSYSCTHKFCQGLCSNEEMGNGPVLSDWTRLGEIISVSTPTIFTVQMSAGFLTDGVRETGFYTESERLEAWADRLREGIIECLADTPNSLLKRQIKVTSDLGEDTYQIELRERFAVPLTVGDELNVSSGCTKSPEMCKLYRNFPNYGGKPFMPLADGMRRS